MYSSSTAGMARGLQARTSWCSCERRVFSQGDSRGVGVVEGEEGGEGEVFDGCVGERGE